MEGQKVMREVMQEMVRMPKEMREVMVMEGEMREVMWEMVRMPREMREVMAMERMKMMKRFTTTMTMTMNGEGLPYQWKCPKADA
jgi:hypothetical protein